MIEFIKNILFFFLNLFWKPDSKIVKERKNMEVTPAVSGGNTQIQKEHSATSESSQMEVSKDLGNTKIMQKAQSFSSDERSMVVEQSESSTMESTKSVSVSSSVTSSKKVMSSVITSSSSMEMSEVIESSAEIEF